jgi:alkanesulfonate monooxygenase SsuD/methylene tetrahydromethanopterin reductase-like flavin-dependent oxidoreductase (luciferase family)
MIDNAAGCRAKVRHDQALHLRVVRLADTRGRCDPFRNLGAISLEHRPLASRRSLDFEGIFFSEHHFGLGFSPSPNLLIAHMAAVTKTLRLGVMGIVLPYYQPWRVVEEIGMLDHLTGGRLEIGTIPQEMAQINLGVEEANERNAEIIEILDKALLNPVITHHGKHWNIDGLRIAP